MSCDKGLGATVRQACGQACDHNTPVRDWFLVDRIDAKLLTPGSSYNVNLRGGPAPVDRHGRKAMVTGIRLVGNHKITLDATNDPVSGYNLLALWSNIYLEDVSGWQYLAALNGRDLWDDRYLRTTRTSSDILVDANGVGADDLPEAIDEDAGAGDIVRAVNLYWPLTRPGERGPGAILAAIPLAALIARGDTAFRFSVPTALPGAPAGVTLGGFLGLTEVWLEYAYLESPVVDRPFQIETYETVYQDGSLRHDDRTHEYAVIRHYDEDDGGMYVADYGGLTVQVNGQTVASAYTLDQFARRTLFKLANAGLTGMGAEDCAPAWMASGGGGYRLLSLVGPAPHSRDGMAAGRVSYNFATRAREKTRFLHRTIACQTVERATAIADATGCSPRAECMGLSPAGICEPSKDTALVITNRRTSAARL